MTGVELSTDSEDEVLAELARSGNDLALDTLLQRYRNHARAKARVYFLAGADREDIVQEGLIGLFKAIRDFRPDKNSSFRAFAELCMTRQLITAIKTASRQKHVPLNTYVSIGRPVGGTGDERSLEEEIVGREVLDPADLVVSAEEIAGIRESLARMLSSLESDVLKMYMDGQSYQEIADSLGRHVKSIDNALQRIKKKLEGYLETTR